MAGVNTPRPGLGASERLAFLARASEILSSSLEYETTLERVAQLAVERLADFCTIELLDENGELLNVAVAHSDPAKAAWARSLRHGFPMDERSPVWTVARTGRPQLFAEITDEMLVANAQNPDHLAALRAIGLASALIVPLRTRERTLGALSLIGADSGRRYGDEDVEFASQLARRAAAAIDNARLYREAERSARDAEEAHALLDAIVEHSPIAKAFLDRDLRYVKVNAAMAAVNDIPADHHLGRTVEELLPQLAEAAVPLMRRALAGEVVTDVELSGQRAATGEGGTCWLASYYPVPARNGEVIGVGELVFDITERRRAEQALQASEARTKAIVDAALDAMVTMSVDGLIVELNPAAEAMFGYSSDDAAGREMAQLFVPERLRDLHRHGLLRYRETGHGEILGKRIEMPALRADGSEFPIELTVTALEVDDPDVPVIFSAAIRDLTDRREADLLNARLAALVQSSDDAVIGKTLDGTIESWNEGATRIYGYTAAEAIGQHISLLSPPERRDELDELLERTRSGERIRNFETNRVTKDGRVIDVALTLSPIQTPDGTVVGTSVIARDITELKRAQQDQHEFELQLLETQKLESLGVLAGGIAHDFNNLLVGILGNTSLAIAQLPGSSPLRETLERVERAAQRTAELTRQMLAYSGKGRYVVEAVDLVGVVKEMTELIETTISKKAQLRFSFGEDTPVVEADVTQVRQVVLNLITNASDALGDTDGTITIASGSVDADRAYLDQFELAEELPEGLYAFLEIADTGMGMDDETRAKIFDPFFTTKFTGRGLGLAAALGNRPRPQRCDQGLLRARPWNLVQAPLPGRPPGARRHSSRRARGRRLARKRHRSRHRRRGHRARGRREHAHGSRVRGRARSGRTAGARDLPGARARALPRDPRPDDARPRRGRGARGARAARDDSADHPLERLQRAGGQPAVHRARRRGLPAEAVPLPRAGFRGSHRDRAAGLGHRGLEPPQRLVLAEQLEALEQARRDLRARDRDPDRLERLARLQLEPLCERA